MMIEKWYEIELKRNEISFIIVGRDAHGYHVDIHSTSGKHFPGDDTLQNTLDSVVQILSKYIGQADEWLDYDTREHVDVWSAIVSLTSIRSEF